MTFRELKSGYPVHLLDRTALIYRQGKVMSVGIPHADLQPGNYGKMLVDVCIQTPDGKSNTYSVCDTEQTAYAGNLLLSCSKECVTNEVRSIKAQTEDSLAKVADAQKTIDNCKALLEELDTAYKDRQETEKRFQTIEEKMDRILTAINNKRL